MFQRLFADDTLAVWPLVGLVLFVTFFVGVLFYVIFVLKDKKKVEQLSSLPLEGESFSSDSAAERRTR